ncbi:hypothetical protein L596_023338 [Steinernema carpocapsae]|uniref:Costars domain-containing protein n=1 Tax=Steinernema carpocapsae TaxID=34508 RepID=A0A4U5MDC0_STECR|nr:hypothetical protein L596_023338 [Steinernema carpocapsae]
MSTSAKNTIQKFNKIAAKNEGDLQKTEEPLVSFSTNAAVLQEGRRASLQTAKEAKFSVNGNAFCFATNGALPPPCRRSSLQTTVTQPKMVERVEQTLGKSDLKENGPPPPVPHGNIPKDARRPSLQDAIAKLNRSTEYSDEKVKLNSYQMIQGLHGGDRRTSLHDAIAKFDGNAIEEKLPVLNSYQNLHGPLQSNTRKSSLHDSISKFSAENFSNDENGKVPPAYPKFDGLGHHPTRKSSMQSAIAKFKAMADETEGKLKINPYSDSYEQPKFDKNATDYARPPPGSKTEKRGIRAGDYVTREILFLMEIIEDNANGEHPNRAVKFGPLFYTYAHYSDKLVGMLLRARKYGLVAFDGEMLYQRQDDHKDITMLKTIDEIKQSMRYSGDPVNCITFV